jgi:hypothetical protein
MTRKNLGSEPGGFDSANPGRVQFSLCLKPCELNLIAASQRHRHREQHDADQYRFNTS